MYNEYSFVAFLPQLLFFLIILPVFLLFSFSLSCLVLYHIVNIINRFFWLICSHSHFQCFLSMVYDIDFKWFCIWFFTEFLNLAISILVNNTNLLLVLHLNESNFYIIGYFYVRQYFWNYYPFTYVYMFVTTNKVTFSSKILIFLFPMVCFLKIFFPVFIWMVWVSPAVLKTTFLKSKQSVMTYRNYRSFDNDKLEPDWKNSLRVRNVSSYLVFEEIFLHVLQRHVSIKQKVTSANHPPYVTKATRKAIMKGTQLQHRYFENSSSETLMPINVS